MRVTPERPDTPDGYRLACSDSDAKAAVKQATGQSVNVTFQLIILLLLTFSQPIPLRLYTLPYWSKNLKNNGLVQYHAGTFKQQQFGTAGVKGVNSAFSDVMCTQVWSTYSWWVASPSHRCYNWNYATLSRTSQRFLYQARPDSQSSKVNKRPRLCVCFFRPMDAFSCDELLSKSFAFAQNEKLLLRNLTWLKSLKFEMFYWVSVPRAWNWTGGAGTNPGICFHGSICRAGTRACNWLWELCWALPQRGPRTEPLVSFAAEAQTLLALRHPRKVNIYNVFHSSTSKTGLLGHSFSLLDWMIHKVNGKRRAIWNKKPKGEKMERVAILV